MIIIKNVKIKKLIINMDKIFFIFIELMILSNFDEISKELSDLGLLKFVSNKDEISSVVENIDAISDSLKKDTNLWLNENRGASKFISKKICKEFNLV